MPEGGMMIRGSRRKPSLLVQVIAVVALLMALPLTFEYLRQASFKRSWLASQVQLQQELATAQVEHSRLEARQAYVQTDAYVEEAARSKLKLARPGEVAVIVVGTVAALQPAPAAQPTPAPAPLPWWRALFRGG